MTPSLSSIAALALIGCGSVVAGWTGKILIADPVNLTPLNVLGINRSPYGEVLAIAMQGPIDVYFEHGEQGQSPAAAVAANKAVQASGYAAIIEELNRASLERTIHTKPSKAYDFYIRRQVEDKLKFAYQLDPANYTNFNAYHFFLTEPAIGTRPVLTAQAAKLAEETIQYCLQDHDDPRTLLTAAAATENILLLMFSDHSNEKPVFTISQMKQHLQLLDYCLVRYHQAAEQWLAEGKWQQLSPVRISETQERLLYIQKTREIARATIQRIERETPDNKGTGLRNPSSTGQI